MREAPRQSDGATHPLKPHYNKGNQDMKFANDTHDEQRALGVAAATLYLERKEYTRALEDAQVAITRAYITAFVFAGLLLAAFIFKIV